jgi:hypothetical protein
LSESTLYVKISNDNLIVISLYVDDLLVTGSDTGVVQQFKCQMMEAFEMTDYGEMSFFFGIEIQQQEKGIFVGRFKYAKEVLKKFNMANCKFVNTPLMQNKKLSKNDGTTKVDEDLYRSLISCLMYLTATRPDILYSVSLLSSFMHCTSEVHFQTARKVLRYMLKAQQILEFGLEHLTS